ncbi:hypothetical protein I302_108637 [Kwoniella bestiolae CBS 10118]|uniref:Uncharacterized protein n=1 Tax=Kwoniella bestiolae CBS 10118 TaxID=1296100 RepID=A0A1B9FTP5_9TREE|nr:hypothetical protein I302_07774 [Kwoniella bestiolae CBS 10118]OCF22132.1 hypothetical protein I302_07774 [Kwoniella bestiolae CBS 10118]
MIIQAGRKGAEKRRVGTEMDMESYFPGLGEGLGAPILEEEKHRGILREVQRESPIEDPLERKGWTWTSVELWGWVVLEKGVAHYNRTFGGGWYWNCPALALTSPGAGAGGLEEYPVPESG